ncbi:hypothetical protein [Amycolatopsis sp. lyj-23]|uniref:hypothetical protein n=1 Tax=Amycolatopsis sp. lyj-23 TaxID=2789283 RepID=UPI00397AEE35
MRVEITEVPADGSVRFVCPAGSARARWHGPARTGGWDVELDFPAAVSTWTVSDHGTGTLTGSGARTRITGRVAAFDPADGVATIEVSGSLVLVEVAPPARIQAGDWLSFTAELHLYPVDL